MGTLDGKTALVTGGSRGIGRAISERFAREGALVAVHYGRNRTAADETVAAIEADGGRAFAVPALLGEEGDVQGLFETLDAELEARTGTTRLDVAVNNAGVGGSGALHEITPEGFDGVFAVNVRAPLFVNQAAAARMGEGGRLIAVSSAVSGKSWPGIVTYAMSKAAIDVMTRNLAQELGPRGITVNAVNPGLVDTDLTAWVHDSPEAEAIGAGASVFDRLGQPEEVAELVAYLASDASRWTTGQHIDVSGGTNV